MKQVIALAFAVPSAIAAIVAACTQLPNLTAGYCGNDIIDRGEQCDTVNGSYGDASYTCYPPDAGAQACHLMCSDGGTCPPGWGCGADDVCREPSGSFQAPLSPIEADIRQLALVDMDGDGRLDVVARGAATTAVSYFDATGLTASSAVTIPRGAVVVGNLLGSGGGQLFALDSVFQGQRSVTGTGIDLWQAQSHTLTPTLFPSIAIQPGVRDCRMVAAHAGLLGSQAGGEDLFTVSVAQADAGSVAFIAYVDPRAGVVPMGGGPMGQPTPQEPPYATIAGDIPAGRLDKTKPCDSFVVGLCATSEAGFATGKCDPYPKPSANTNYAYAYLSCATGDGGLVANTSPPTQITFNNPIVGPVLLLDTNGDGNLDALTGTNPGGTADSWLVEIALGDGAGGFAPATTTSVRAGADGGLELSDAGVATGGLLVGPLLAAGFIDGDAILDYVDVRGVFLSTLQTHVTGAGDLALAKLADVNGDGKVDVVAIGANGVDFWAGTDSPALNHDFYALPGASWIGIGDVDGDFINDVVVTTSGTNPASVSVLYGQLSGYPQAPALVGNLSDIEHVTTGGITWLFGDPPDTIQSPIVTAVDGTTGHVAVVPIQGHGDRQLTSPFLLALLPGGGLLDGGESFTPLRNVPIAATIGNVPHPSIPDTLDASLVVLATSQPEAGTGSFALQLWTAPASADASTILSALPPPSPMNVSIAATAAAKGAAMTAVDWDSSGSDEVFLFIPDEALASPPQGQMFLLSNSSGSWQSLNSDTSFAVNTHLVRGADVGVRLATADFDGDGRKDLLVVYGQTEPAGFTGFFTSPLAAAILLDDGTPSSALWSKAIHLTLPPGTGGVAPINALGDGKAQIAFATPAGVTLHELAGRDLVDVDGGMTSTITSGLTDPIDLVAGDVNGDGVDDLVVAEVRQFAVILGRPVVP